VGGFEERAVRVLRSLRPGQLMTYGEVAEEAGSPGAARAVGNILARSDGLPWWRVVTSTGRLVPGHERTQSRLLRQEGVPVQNGRVIPGAGRVTRLRSAGRRPEGLQNAGQHRPGAPELRLADLRP
jgi:methylated-DNA-protein-cysteine methyltransferase related protein